jgi:UDP-glucose 4-epimerase
MADTQGLVVAVTGPTGEIGKPFIRALERSRDVKRIVGMARRPFDAKANGFKRIEYVQGDILDRAAVEDVAGVPRLVAGADVVVHLAFIIVASEGTRDINLEGSANVFGAAAAAGVQRLVYTSSVAAYGFDEDLPDVLTEDVATDGTPRHPYSAQKAQVERLLADTLAGSNTAAYVFRPSIVAGPDAPILVNSIPYVSIGEKLPRAVRALFDQVPILKPVLPDPGIPFQLVHHDDVAAALRAAVLGRGAPGVYNLAGPGQCTVRALADALGYYSLPIPELAIDATAEIVARLPFLPPEARWIEAFRRPVLMDCAKARRELKWRPKYDADATLRATVEAARAELSA